MNEMSQTQKAKIKETKIRLLKNDILLFVVTFILNFLDFEIDSFDFKDFINLVQ